MSCSRGRVNPDEQTRLRLFADSGGYCQKPDCLRRLFVETENTRLHIAEMAHILAAGDRGPRSNEELTPEERSRYENLILLCPLCHTIVDKAPKDFPDALLLEWKRRHVERLAETFGAVEYGSRQAARKAVEPTLAENRAIFDEYSPDNDYRFNPESELADVWKRKVVSRILPNNRSILAVVDANRKLLTGPEIATLEIFRQHVDDLEARHIGDGSRAVGRRFPSELSDVFIDAEDD